MIYVSLWRWRTPDCTSFFLSLSQNVCVFMFFCVYVCVGVLTAQSHLPAATGSAEVIFVCAYPRSNHYLYDLISLQLPRPSPVIVQWSREIKHFRMNTEYLRVLLNNCSNKGILYYTAHLLILYVVIYLIPAVCHSTRDKTRI